MKWTVVFIAIALAASGITSLAFFYSAYHAVEEIPISIEVGPKLGITSDADHLNFGTNRPGNENRRFIEVSSAKQSRVVVTFSGDIAPWMETSENNFTLEPEQIKQLTISAHIPSDAEYGKVTGLATVYYHRR